MKRDFITELLKDYIEDEAKMKEIVDAVMAENGKDINTAKGDYETLEGERDNLKEQLADVTARLDEFKDVDADALNGKIEELTKSLADKEEEYKKKISDMEFSQTVSSYISKAGGRSEKAIKALLDVDALKASQNQKEDIEAAITKLKTDADYLFQNNEPIANPTGPTGGGTKDTGTDELRVAMGLPPEENN